MHDPFDEREARRRRRDADRRRARDHGIDPEPHLRVPGDPDDADMLEEEPLRASVVEHEADDDAVVDEPAMTGLLATGLAPVVDRERFPGFADRWERSRHAPASSRVLRAWLLLAGAAVAGGPVAVAAAFANALTRDAQDGIGVWAIVLFTPVLEEMLKVGLLLWLVERTPWRVPGGLALVLAGTLAGFGFGAIENLVYQYVYVPDMTADLRFVRWALVMPMHALASATAAIGLARMHARARDTGAPAPVSLAFPWLVAAMTIHGLWNLYAVLTS